MKAAILACLAVVGVNSLAWHAEGSFTKMKPVKLGMRHEHRYDEAAHSIHVMRSSLGLKEYGM